jgi:hypothetical protein
VVLGTWPVATVVWSVPSCSLNVTFAPRLRSPSTKFEPCPEDLLDTGGPSASQTRFSVIARKSISGCRR